MVIGSRYKRRLSHNPSDGYWFIAWRSSGSCCSGADPNARWCPFESRAGIPPHIPGCESKSGVTPLVAAAAFDQADTTYLLLDAGADPTLTIGTGASPLDRATGRAVFELLLAAQFPDRATRRAAALAYLGRTAPPGETALGELLVGSLRRDSWVNPPPPPPPGSVSLEREPMDPRAARTELLLSVGANPNQGISSDADWPPLAVAVSAGDWQSTRVLLAHGADPNARWCTPVSIPFDGEFSKPPSGCTAARGTTPLMAAATAGHDAVVRVLLQSGADQTLRDWQNKTARDHAVEKEHGFVIAALDGRAVYAQSSTTPDAQVRASASARGSARARRDTRTPR
jgi:hypothetical protein